MGRRATGTFTLGLALAGAILASTGCEIRAGEGDVSFDLASGRAADTWTRTYQVDTGGRVEILNTNGEIRAEAAPGGPVEVRVERTVRATSDEAARDMLAKVEMREEASASRVRIETIGPRLRLGGLTASFVVRVPPGVHVDLRTVNGGVRLDNVGGEVRATATNGGVRGRVAAVSVLDARTTNGGVDVQVTGPVSAEGRVSLASVNGGVKLAVPADTRANVHARCVNGRVTVSDLDVATDDDGESRRRRLQGTLNGGGARIDLQTTNGGVTIGRS
jgi:hypothetical protein